MMNKKLRLFRYLPLIFLLGSSVSMAAETAADKRLSQAEHLLSRGKAIEALEAYSRYAGQHPEDRQALEGIKTAKNQIRQQMGDVSAARLTQMLDKLEDIDARRVRELTARVAELEDTRRDAVAQIARLEGDLKLARKAQVPSDGSEATDPSRVREELVAARNAEKAVRSQVDRLNQEIDTIRQDNQKALQAASTRIEDLVARNERVQTEKQQAEEALDKLFAEKRLLGIRIGKLEEQNQDLAARHENLSQRKEQLEKKIAQLSEASPPSVKPNHELAILQAELKDLEKRNQSLALAARKSRTGDDSGRQPADDTNPMQVPALEREVASLKSQVDRMDRELQAARQEKENLADKVGRLRNDLSTRRSQTDNQRLRGIAREAASQSLGIKQLSATISQSQTRCDALLEQLESRDIRDPDSGTLTDARRQLASLKDRLAGLTTDLPAAVPAPEPVSAKINRRLAVRADQWLDEASSLQSGIAAAEVSVGNLEQGLDTGAEDLEQRLRKMDAMQKDAHRTMERLKRQLREAEALIEDAG